MDKVATSFKQFFSNFENGHALGQLPGINTKIKERKVGNYLIGGMIGKGGFGKLFKAFDLIRKIQVAVKIIESFDSEQKKKQHEVPEVLLLKLIEHPNIVKCYQIIQRENSVFIFMQLIKGKELFQIITQKHHLSETTALKIFYQLCSAIRYLHQMGIYHRDIKAQNVIVQDDCQVKLIDFGLAKRAKKNDLLQTICGYASYKSPQLLARNNYSGKKNDVWSLGVLLFTMIEGRYPFVVKKQCGEKMRIDNNFFEMYKSRIKLSSKQVWRIYQKIFVSEGQRINVNELLYYIGKQQNFGKKPNREGKTSFELALKSKQKGQLMEIVVGKVQEIKKMEKSIVNQGKQLQKINEKRFWSSYTRQNNLESILHSKKIKTLPISSFLKKKDKENGIRRNTEVSNRLNPTEFQEESIKNLLLLKQKRLSLRNERKQIFD